MNEDERKVRIKQLWLKLRMYVRLRNRIGMVKEDIGDRIAEREQQVMFT